jgi:hypothetical protein
MPAAASPTFQIVMPVDTTALSDKGLLPGWLALSVKCNLFSYKEPGTAQPATLIGSGTAQHVPAKADANGKAITMVKIVATETTPTAMHATYSCAGSADAIAGTKHLSTAGGPVTGLITEVVTTTPPLVITLIGTNPSPAEVAPPHSNAAGGHVVGSVLVALNPQPEPPGVVSAVTATAHVTSAAERVALNPQPEPPGITFDARKLPPGPCRSLLVVVKVPGLPPVTAQAAATGVAGKCAFDILIPNATAGSRAALTFSRER